MKTFFSLAFVVAMLAAFYGWVMNIYYLASGLGDFEVTTMFIARIVGIFFLPLGVILGYF